MQACKGTHEHIVSYHTAHANEKIHVLPLQVCFATMPKKNNNNNDDDDDDYDETTTTTTDHDKKNYCYNNTSGSGIT